VVAVRAAPVDPDDGGRRCDRRQPALVDDRGCRLSRNPQPGELHAAGDGPNLAAVDLSGEPDHRRDDVHADLPVGTRYRADWRYADDRT
jgi:hypothetical protein